MNIKLSQPAVRAMADRLRAALNPVELCRGKSLEVVAQVLGWKNWDTLAGMLHPAKAEAPTNRVTLDSPVLLFVQAFSVDAHRASPQWAKVVITQELVDELVLLSTRCTELHLSHVAKLGAPSEWELDEDDPVYMESRHLYVSSNAFWYRGIPKHQDYGVETRRIELDMLLLALQKQPLPLGYGEHLQWAQSNVVNTGTNSDEFLVYAVSDTVPEFIRELVLHELHREPVTKVEYA